MSEKNKQLIPIKKYLNDVSLVQQKLKELETTLFQEDLSREDVEKNNNKLIILEIDFSWADYYRYACIPTQEKTFLNNFIPLIVDNTIRHHNTTTINDFRIFEIDSTDQLPTQLQFSHDFFFDQPATLKYTPLQDSKKIKQKFDDMIKTCSLDTLTKQDRIVMAGIRRFFTQELQTINPSLSLQTVIDILSQDDTPLPSDNEVSCSKTIYKIFKQKFLFLEAIATTHNLTR